MYDLFYFLCWAGMWMWVVKVRGDWRPELAHLAGAASGMAVWYAVSFIGGRLVPVEPAPTNPLNGVDLVIALTFVGIIAGIWMRIIRLPQPKNLILRHLLGCACGVFIGFMMLTIMVVNFGSTRPA